MVHSAIFRSANRPAQAWHWLACGWRLAHRSPQRFVAMSLWYVLIAVLLARLPFLGPLLLVLITPALAGGAWLTLRELTDDRAPAPTQIDGERDGLRSPLRRYVAQPLHALLRALSDERRALSTVVLCLVCLGVVMALKIIEYVLIGGSLISALQSPEVMSWLRPTTMAAMVVVVILTVLAAMGLIFVVPLVLEARLDAFAALGRSFVGSAHRFLPVALFVVPFVIVDVALAYLFTINIYLGYFATFTLAPIALASFLGGIACSFGDVFPPEAATVAHGH